VLLAATGWSGTLTSWLQLVELPSASFKATLVAVIVADFALCAGLEWSLRKVFGMGRRL